MYPEIRSISCSGFLLFALGLFEAGCGRSSSPTPVSSPSPSQSSENVGSTTGHFGRALKEELSRADPNQGKWNVEKFHERAKQQLDLLGVWIFSPADTQNELFASSVSSPGLDGMPFVTQRDSLGVSVRRADVEPHGAAVLPERFREAIQKESGFVSDAQFKMKVLRVAAQAPDTASVGITDGYLMAWAAVTRLLARGGSLSRREPNTCFQNLSKGGNEDVRFADISGASHFDFLDDARSMALTDWDFDGDLDLWVLNRSAPQLRFLKNAKPNNGRFIAFLLDAPTGSRDAIGARVEVELKGDAKRNIVRSRTVTAGTGFLSQSTRWLHFGLGWEDPEIVAVRVRWPDGPQQTVGPLAANRFYRWTQGKDPRQRDLPEDRFDAKPAELPLVKDTAVARVTLTGRPVVPRVHPRIRSITKPTLISLWATWCTPCMAELTEWRNERDRFAAHGVEVLTLNVDSPDVKLGTRQDEIARRALQQIGVDFPDDVLPPESAAVLDFFQ